MLVWLAGTFALAQIIASGWFDYVQPRVRFAHLYRQFDMLQGQPVPDFLCLGSSRFGTCLNDVEMMQCFRKVGLAPRVFNLGVPLGDVVASENTLEQALSRNLRPRLVLLEISPEFVNADNGWLEYHLDRHLRWDHVPRFLGELWEQGQGGKWLEERLLPWYVHRKGYWNAWGDLATSAWRDWRGFHDAIDARRDWEHTLDLNVRTRLTIDNPRTEAVLKTIQNHLLPYHPGGATARSLDRVLRRCRGEGINIVLVSPPLRSDHRRLYSSEIETAFHAYVERVVSRYGITFWDGRTTLADDRFLDNQHVDAEGSRQFSRLLCSQPSITDAVRRAMAGH